MSIEIVDSDVALSFSDWLKNDTVHEYQRQLEERIIRFLFTSDPNDFSFQKTVVQLAYIGTLTKEKSFSLREIKKLKLTNETGFIQCKEENKLAKIANFIWEHKTEILVGAALCATGAGIAAATGYTLSTVVGGVVVAGAGSIFNEEEPKQNPHIPRYSPLVTRQDLAALEQASSLSLPKIEISSTNKGFFITSEGIWVNDQFYPNQQYQQHSHFAKEFTPSPLSSSPESNVPSPSAPPLPKSQSKEQAWMRFQDVVIPEISALRQSTKFIVPGSKPSAGYILWINGINNTFQESYASGSYIQELADGHTVCGIYNFSNGPVVDLLEAGLVNHIMGSSLITTSLLQEEWKAFHERNANRPNLKAIQICHSQGAIDVKNALQNSTQEIRERIIVVAIAPAAIVPEEICFKSYNYSSKNDFIPKTSPIRPIEFIEDVPIHHFEEESDNYKRQLILLAPHPLAKNFDHSFQSPTFLEVLENRLEDYKLHGGEYLPEEKGSIEK